MSVPTAEPYLRVTVKFDSDNGGEELVLEATARDGGLEVDMERHRQAFVDGIRCAMKLMKTDPAGAQEIVKQLVSEITESEASKDPRVVALAEDLTGQVTEALSKSEYYTKWGVHYLPSLMRAHQLQQCNNFKDPGIQHYGGKLFRTLRDEIDDIFIKLPPPKPTFPLTRTDHAQGFTFVAPVTSMRVYHSNSNPCFAGDCVVDMANGSKKLVSRIQKGDRVASSSCDPAGAEVLCVVRSDCHRGRAHLVELKGGLLATPYHPIRHKGDSNWHFPCQLGQVEERNCTAVFSFVLHDKHIMVINNMECVTLGHGFVEDDVVRHSYFGSGAVLNDLAKLPGWTDGIIRLPVGCVVRDPVTGDVSGLCLPHGCM